MEYLNQIYLDIRQIKALLYQIQNLCSIHLKNELISFINSNKTSEYLCNILSENSINELNNILNNNKIISFIVGI